MLRIVELVIGPTAAEVSDQRRGGDEHRNAERLAQRAVLTEGKALPPSVICPTPLICDNCCWMTVLAES
jgi:hypothetical protein